MHRRLKTSLAVAAVAALALSLLASPAAAKRPAAKKACWVVLINDWYDTKIDGRYALKCYREALEHLRGDTYALGYTSAYDDINRAYQKRRAELAALKKGGTGSAGTAVPPTGGSPNPPPPSASAPKKKGGPTGGGRTKPGQTTSKPPAAAPPSGVQENTGTGRDSGRGPAQDLIGKLGPDDATSIPIPLIVLAGIAVLLMVAGTASLLARRNQSRRVTVPVRPVPPARTR